MLLAGGQGSRLGVLTAKVAKPAVAFGGEISDDLFSIEYLKCTRRYAWCVDPVPAFTFSIHISELESRGIWIAM